MTSRRPLPPVGPPGQPEPHAEVSPHAQADDAWGTVISLCFSVRDWWSALCEELDLTPVARDGADEASIARCR